MEVFTVVSTRTAAIETIERIEKDQAHSTCRSRSGRAESARSVSVRARIVLEAVWASRGEGSSFPPEGLVEEAEKEEGDAPGPSEPVGLSLSDRNSSRGLAQESLIVPAAVRAAFDEALDLYRAVSGGRKP